MVVSFTVVAVKSAMNYNIINVYRNATLVNIAPVGIRLLTDLALPYSPGQAVINTTSPPSHPHRSCAATVFLALVLTVIVILTIIGNALVIVSIVASTNLRTTTYYFIANLALADLLLGTTVLPFSATLEVLQYWVFGQVFCDMWAAIDVLCCTASILSLCVISIDRYIGVTRPLQHGRIMCQARTIYVIIFIWLLSMAISVAPLVGWKEEQNPNPLVCTVTTQPGYVLFSVSGSFYIPCLIILVVYFRIYRETVKYTRCLSSGAKLSRVDEDTVVSLRIHMGKCARTESRHDPYPVINRIGLMPDYNSAHAHCSTKKNKHGSRSAFLNKVAKFNREKKAAKTLGVVVGVFIICWLPFFIILPLDSLCSNCSVPPVFFKMCFWLGYCNSTVNPVVYTCSSNEFRRAFLNILCCRRLNKRSLPSRSEFQMRATDNYGYRRRAIRQKIIKEPERQASIRDMSSTSSSSPQNNHVKKSIPGRVHLPQTLLTIGSVGTQSLSLEITDFHSVDSVTRLCSNCKGKCSHIYQNGISHVSGKSGSSEQAFANTNYAFHQNCLPEKQSRDEKSSRNDGLLTQEAATDSTYMTDTPSVCQGVFSHELWGADSCAEKNSVSGCPVTDLNTSDRASCYSLAETVSFSE